MELSINAMPFMLADYSSLSEEDGKIEYFFVGGLLDNRVGKEIRVDKVFIIPSAAPGEGYAHDFRISNRTVNFMASGIGAEYLTKWCRENQLLAYEPPTATQEHNIYPINGATNG